MTRIEPTPDSRFRAAFLAVALLILGATTVVAGAGGGGGYSGSGGGDAIGSLPGSLGQPEGTNSSVASALPVLALRGTPAELSRVITGTSGDGVIEQVALADGVIDLLFHGQVSVWLDKHALATSSVTVRVDVHPMFGTHTSKIKYDGQTVSRSLRTPVDMPLALSAMLALPKISTGSQVSIVLVNAKHKKQLLGVQDVGASVRLDQRY